MTTLQQFPVFLREHGLIHLDDLASPEPTLIKRLPANSALHYLGSEDTPSLDPSDPLMLGYSVAVRHMNISKLAAGTRGGLPKALMLSQLAGNFDRKNRGFKVIKEFKDLKPLPSSQLMVFNYGYLDTAYKYPDVPSAEYTKFENKLATMVDTIKNLEQSNPRNHFVVLDVPANLVPKSMLDKDLGTDKVKLARAFPGTDEQMLRQMWQFLIPAKKLPNGASVKNDGELSVFDSFTSDELRKVNLIFKSYDGKYTLVNLGYLYSWVRGNPNLTLVKTVTTKDFADVQRYLLRGMIVMQTINTTGASEAAKEEALRKAKAEAEDQQKDEEDASSKDDRFLQDQEYNAATVRDKSGLDEVSPVIGADGTRTSEQIQAANNSATGTAPDTPAVDESALNADLDALEKIYNAQQLTKGKRDKEKAIEVAAKAPDIADQIPEEGYVSDIPESAEEIRSKFFVSKSAEQLLIERLDRMAEEGRITATEYRKRLEMIKAAPNISDPYGSGKTISQAAIVTKKELDISREETVLNVPPTVIDKSMAHSTLSVIARKYNTETIYKDTLAMVQSLQKGGVVIKDYRITRHAEITGEYEVHSLDIVPLGGMPSTISFRVPRILIDGTFVAKNTKYVMRKQMVD